MGDIQAGDRDPLIDNATRRLQFQMAPQRLVDTRKVIISFRQCLVYGTTAFMEVSDARAQVEFE